MIWDSVFWRYGRNLPIVEKAVAAVKWCSPSLIVTLIFYLRTIVCGRFFQLLIEMSPGCLTTALVPGGAESMGIDHASPCKSSAYASYATLPLLLKKKLLLALRTNFNGKRTNRKRLQYYKSAALNPECATWNRGRRITFRSSVYRLRLVLGLDLEQGCSIMCPSQGMLPFTCFRGSQTPAGSKPWTS